MLGARPAAILADYQDVRAFSVISAFIPLTSYRAYKALKAWNSELFPRYVFPGPATGEFTRIVLKTYSVATEVARGSTFSHLTKASLP